jgi:hypothetical protein
VRSGFAVQVDTEYLAAKDLKISMSSTNFSIIQDDIIKTIPSYQSKGLMKKAESSLLAITLFDQQAHGIQGAASVQELFLGRVAYPGYLANRFHV